MNQYELAFIVDSDIAEDKREKIVAAVKSLIQQNKAEPGELETWGKRDFSFTIKKNTSGVYYLLYFQAESDVIAAVERKLRIDTNLLRYLIVRQVKRKLKKAQPRLVPKYRNT